MQILYLIIEKYFFYLHQLEANPDIYSGLIDRL